MKATLNQIAENLAKVFTDKAESAQYYSENEQFVCLCGWCGTMSPVSRPAYIKTFGKTTTEEAEAKAQIKLQSKELYGEFVNAARSVSGSVTLCPMCGASVTDGSRFCGNCGTKLC